MECGATAHDFTRAVLDSHLAATIAALAHTDLRARMDAEHACIAAGSLWVVPLCEIAHDVTQPDEARWRAATILGDLGDSRVGPTLIALCADESHDPRQGAIWALGWLRHAEAFDSLLRVVNNVREDEQVRFVAACSLLSVDTSRAYPLLLELSRNAPDGVRRAARAALANLAERKRSQEDFDHE